MFKLILSNYEISDRIEFHESDLDSFNIVVNRYGEFLDKRYCYYLPCCIIKAENSFINLILK